MGYDARSIANALLAESWSGQVELSHIQLQKLVFLCHAFYLIENSSPLITGHFEAWNFGPVNKEVYQAFKQFKDRPITELAVKKNLINGDVVKIEPPIERRVLDTIRKVFNFYGDWPAAKLVSLTHAKNGPWHYVVSTAVNRANMGLRIDDSVIRDRFKFLWFGAHPPIKSVNTHEDSPFT